MDRHDLAFLRYRIERRIALIPHLRIAACCLLAAGGAACVVSGLLALDSWLTSALDLVLGIFFTGLGAALWSLE